MNKYYSYFQITKTQYAPKIYWLILQVNIIETSDCLPKISVNNTAALQFSAAWRVSRCHCLLGARYLACSQYCPFQCKFYFSSCNYGEDHNNDCHVGRQLQRILLNVRQGYFGKSVCFPLAQPGTGHHSGWVKANTDGSVRNLMSACGGVFRDSRETSLGGFTSNLSIVSVFQAEIMGLILAMEYASSNSWTRLWLESDSSSAVQAFHKPSLIPVGLLNHWHNCTHKGLFIICLRRWPRRFGTWCPRDHVVHLAASIFGAGFY